MIPTVAPYLLPKILGPIRRALPTLKIQLTEGQTAVISRLLREGDLDAVILALPLDEENVVERLLYTEPFYLAVSRSHPKSNRKKVTVDDLEDEQVLLLEDGHCLRDQALAVCDSHNAVENTNFRATSLETLRQMVAADVPGKPGAGIRYIPFRGEVPHRDVGLCWRKSSPREPLLEKLAEVLTSALG